MALRRSQPSLTQVLVLRAQVLLLGLILAGWLAGTGAATAGPFSEAETEWLAAQRPITVGVVADNEPYSFFRNGRNLGWTIDVLDRIEAITGLSIIPRMGAWREIYGTFRDGGLDAIADISRTDERLPFTAFTDAYHLRRTMVFHNVDRPLTGPVDVATLAERRVGVIKDIYYTPALVAAGIEPVVYDTYRDLMAALAFGWVDAVIAAEMTGNFFARENGFVNVAAVGPLALTGVALEDFRLGVLRVPGDRDREMLHAVLTKAVAAIPTADLAAITERWLSYRDGRILTAGPLRLLPEEQAFIAGAPPLKVGFISDYEPFSFLANGRGQGFAVELAHEISARTGLAIDPVFDNWTNLLTAFKAGEIDVISNISRTEAREAFTVFSREYYRIPNAVFVRSGFGPYRGLPSLAGHTVGIGENIYYAEALKNRLPDVRTYATQEEIVAALAGGEVDAAIIALSNGNAIIRHLGLINIEIGGEFLMDGVEREDLRFGVSPRYPFVRSIIDRTMAAIPTSRWNELETRWLGPSISGIERQRAMLTTEQRAYLDSKGVVKVCIDPASPPYMAVDRNGAFTGVAAEVMGELAERGGFAWQVVPVTTRGLGPELLARHDCDVVPFAMERNEPGPAWNFTAPYLSLPMAVVSELQDPFVEGMAGLAGLRVGVVPGQSPAHILARRYPDVTLVEMDSEAEALEAVRDGTLDAALGTLPSLGYLIASERAGDVKIAGRIAEDWRASFATDADKPQLAAIFSKLLASLDESAVQAILSRQMLIRIERQVDYTRLLVLAAGAGLVLALVFYWNRKLKRLNDDLAAANGKLQEVSITDRLTGLHNRHHFDARSAEEFAVCQRNGWLFSIAMVDADHFKAVNDELGHVFGDLCLRHLAALCLRIFRRGGDVLARYGGEEFVIFTLGGSPADFTARLEALRRAVEEAPVVQGSQTCALTVSIGSHSAVPQPADTLADFIRRADARLYEAKRDGRNRVVTGSGRGEDVPGPGGPVVAAP
ncbi:transporter substrate-binding domain-containing protein [Acuticoccus sp. I52.16.1]|uniref:transporter substrate-binding domain-containing diguanylate cyclase n=1 Tax=Acuticoccus sp. I52.16.1 TaxID=2928472 RepID=UPI001FCFE25A|nr:transporter substrate-binding domain-containing protein [Acuticoccus sp. I52.16.1]UOM37158.1 transporter substrate-binding domain-containing protein [Acuticoccus sp. I52.16.1]